MECITNANSKPIKDIHFVSPVCVRHLPNSEKKLLKKLYPFVLWSSIVPPGKKNIAMAVSTKNEIQLICNS